MTVEELKVAIYNIVKEYFAETNVIWDEGYKSVNPGVNLVSLKLMNVQRSVHFIDSYEDDVMSSQPSTATIRVQLFSKGQVLYVDGIPMTNNTAVDDLLDFEHYLLSPYVTEELCFKTYNIALQVGAQVQDITEVLDTAFDYRATMEIIVSFVQKFKGRAGIDKPDWKPTPSGGGTSELASKRTGYIGKVEITDPWKKQNQHRRKSSK